MRPVYASAFLVDGSGPMVALLMAGSMLQYFFLSAQFNIAQAVVSPRVRATSVAILLFVVNLIGYGMGPPVLGIVAEAVSASGISANELAGQITATCSLTDPSLSDALVSASREARAVG